MWLLFLPDIAVGIFWSPKLNDHQQRSLQFSILIDFAISNRLSSALLTGGTMSEEQCCQPAWVLSAVLIWSLSSGDISHNKNPIVNPASERW